MAPKTPNAPVQVLPGDSYYGDSRPGQCRQQLEAERGPADADGRLAAAERRAAEAEADLCPRPPGAVKRP